MIRKARLRLQAGLLFPAPCRERGKGRDISFSKRDIPPLHPPRENLHCKRAARRAAMLADCTAIARRSRVSIAIRFASAPIIRCCSAHLVEVRSNLRLPRHYSMRRAQQCRYFASSLPPGKRHSRLTTVRRGCCQVATRRDSWRSHVHRTHTAQRVQPFKLQTRNVRGQGAVPLAFSWGSKGAILSRERMAPLSVQRHRRCLSLPRRARETPSPVGQIKKVQLF